jgi:regulator of sigma E protease
VSVALFLLAITVLIFVHELGHFLAARSVGVRVLCFSIGFGPALARFQYGHTEFRLAMIPLGGYLKMLGDSPDGSTDAGSAVESFAAQTPLRRAWIAFAGPLANLLLAWVLFAALVWGVPEEPSTRLEQPAAGTLAATLGIERGDRVMAVDNASVDHWRAPCVSTRKVSMHSARQPIRGVPPLCSLPPRWGFDRWQRPCRSGR